MSSWSERSSVDTNATFSTVGSKLIRKHVDIEFVTNRGFRPSQRGGVGGLLSEWITHPLCFHIFNVCTRCGPTLQLKLMRQWNLSDGFSKDKQEEMTLMENSQWSYTNSINQLINNWKMDYFSTTFFFFIIMLTCKNLACKPVPSAASRMYHYDPFIYQHWDTALHHSVCQHLACPTLPFGKTDSFTI